MTGTKQVFFLIKLIDNNRLWDVSIHARELNVHGYLGGLIQPQKLSWPLFTY